MSFEEKKKVEEQALSKVSKMSAIACHDDTMTMYAKFSRARQIVGLSSRHNFPNNSPVCSVTCVCGLQHMYMVIEASPPCYIIP